MAERFELDRRHLLGGAGLLGAALLLPSSRLAAQALAGFTHGVASGEPGPNSMLFWTRFQGSGAAAVPLRLEVSTDPRMARARVMAEAVADPARDWTARATVTGLEPGRTYYYRWLGPSRSRSMIGRTKTLPVGMPEAVRLGVFSCSSLAHGWFNGYAHAVAADDIDLMVHLGDYLYEYPRGTYPYATSAVPGRVLEPAHEIVAKADYWARYRSYRADADLQALHARLPSVTTWDDHETANDAWVGGAENHQAEEGPWEVRLAAARAAYRDWMPVSDAAYARYDFGRLLALYRLDTRVEGRDRQLDIAEAIKAGPDTMTALKRMRDEQWMAGNRQLLGARQEAWLFDEMEKAAKGGTRWQMLAQQVVMGKIMMPPGASALAGPNPDPQVAAFLGAAELASKLGIPMNLDAWDGYPAARGRVLAAAQRLGVDLVVLAGDSHNAWANDLVNDNRPAGVEFAVQSVTSPGFETYLPQVPPTQVASALMAANPTLRWAATAGRGYLAVTVTGAETRAEWRFTRPVAKRETGLERVQRGRVAAGQRRLMMG